MAGFDHFIWIFPLMILMCIFLVKYTKNIGVPSLIIFITIGMLSGVDGIMKIDFDNPELAKSIGIVCLVYILFAGGLDTSWKMVKKQAPKAIVLSTAGVLITTVIMGFLLHYLIGLEWKLSLLIGAIVSSTDAAAVFAMLRAGGVKLKDKLQPILELESGTNDPMAVFLTVIILDYIVGNISAPWKVPLLFLWQMGVGLVFGLILGKAYVYFVNRLKSPYEGFYPVFGIAFSLFIYGITGLAGGSGFLSVYVAALIISEYDFIHKKSLLRFFDGLAWMSQIVMFLVLGLLVVPSALPAIALKAFLIALILIFIARPASVFLTMLPFGLNIRELSFLSWVGLRGAVPIILATFAFIAGIEEAELIFNVVFFVVVTSVIIQGWSLPYMAKWLSLTEKGEDTSIPPVEFIPAVKSDQKLVDIKVPANSPVVGQQLVQINLPKPGLVVLVIRNGGYIVPTGSTEIQANDTLQLIVSKDKLEEVKQRIYG